MAVSGPLKKLIGTPLTAVWALIAGVAIGVAPLVYHDLSQEPQVVGRVVTAACGELADTTFVTGPVSSVITYVYIANKRDVPVPIVDYEMELEFKDGRRKQLKTFYLEPAVISMHLPAGAIMDIPMNEWHLLRRADHLVSKDTPLYGFIVFYWPDLTLHKQWFGVQTYHLTLIDGFGKRHLIRTPAAELRDSELLPFLVPDASLRPAPRSQQNAGATPN